MREYRYDAFISYRHVEPDRRWARWLHTSLESYRVPADVVRDLGVERRLGRVFRDEEELQASADLSHEIETALAASNYLIVVCSPATPASRWVEQEILRFREVGRGDHILALLIRGEPQEAFPAPLWELRRDLIDESGAVVGQQVEDAEPMAADVRPHHHLNRASVRRNALLRIVSLLLGCRFDDLRRRHVQRRRRRLFVLAGIASVVLLGFLTLGGFGIYQAVKRAEADAYNALARERELQRLERAARNTEASLLLVGTGRRSGAFITRNATAWVAAPGILATSAHVTETHDPIGGDSVFVARSTVPPHPDHLIERVTVHPGFSAFRELLDELHPIDPYSGRPEPLVDACDVALLHVAADDARGLGPSLRIASGETLRGSEPGGDVACLSFGSEGLTGRTAMGAVPRPRVTKGVYTGLVDVLSEPSPVEDALRVTFDLLLTGGASGSPVFDGRGEVLAVLSGGTFHSVNGRHMQVGAAARGDRADLVRELLDGVAEERMPARRKAWKVALRERVALMARAYADVVLLSVDQRMARLNDSAVIQGWEMLLDAHDEIEEMGSEAGPLHVVSLPREGFVVVVAVAHRKVDIELAASIRGERSRFRPREADDQRQATSRILAGGAGQEVEVRAMVREPLDAPVGCTLRAFLSVH